MEQEIKIASLVATLTLGFSGITISYLLYRLNRRLRQDAWLRHFNEIHQEFWTDEDMKKVRHWISTTRAYAETLQPVLVKIQGSPDDSQLSDVEYEVIDKLDKFLNLMVRVIFLNPQFESQRKLLDLLFFKYWICRARGDKGSHDPERLDLKWYVKEYYESLDRAVIPG